jgi:drug/metabolite transporter (DMT)-like permease
MLFFVKAETVEELLSLSVNSYLTLALIGLMNNIVGDVFYFIAIRDIGVSLAAPITSSYPLAVALVSWLWFGETLTFSILSGTFSVVAGLALLNIKVAETRSERKSRHLRGVVSAFLAALCWAMGLALNKRLTLHGVSATALTFWRGIFFSLMAVALLPLVTRGEKRARHVPAGSALAAASAGIIALVIGGWFYATSISIIPMNVATPVASSSPLITAVFACAFMGESLRPIQWLGIVFVVAGAVIVSI